MNKLLISPSPHVHSGDSIEKNMYGVLIALIPAFICSVLFFGMGAIIVTLTSVIENPANKYTLVDFWASWCGPCMGEVPHLKKTYDEFRKKGFEIYGVSFDEDRGDWCITGFQRTFELTGLDYRYRCPGGNRHR